jgi:protoporphyrinogen oxidase
LEAELQADSRFCFEPINASDILIFACPHALLDYTPELGKMFPKLFVRKPLTTVLLRFSGPRPLKRAAGFWMSNSESMNPSPVLGGWFHSRLFPEIAVDEEVRIFFDGRVPDEEAIAQAISFMGSHFGISDQPLEANVAIEEIPAFPVGHAEELLRFNEWRTREAPHIQVCGPGFYSASITDVVSDCKDLALQLRDRYGSWPLVENELASDWGNRGGFRLDSGKSRATRSKVSLASY